MLCRLVNTTQLDRYPPILQYYTVSRDTKYCSILPRLMAVSEHKGGGIQSGCHWFSKLYDSFQSFSKAMQKTANFISIERIIGPMTKFASAATPAPAVSNKKIIIQQHNSTQRSKKENRWLLLGSAKGKAVSTFRTQPQ